MAIETGNVTKQQKIIMGILAAVGLFMFYQKVYMPLEEDIKKASEELEKKQAELVDLRRKAAQLDKLEKEIELIKEYSKVLEKKLPKTRELPEFIRNITEKATKYGMNLNNLKVESPSASSHYVRHEYKMDLTSDFHNFGKFFTEIVNQERVFGIKDVLFVPSQDSESLKEALNVSFSILAYTSK